MVILSPTTLIESGDYRFLITDAPSNEHLEQYIKVLQSEGVTDLVRTCELTYSEELIQQAGINCHDLAFADGDPPPKTILDEWLDLVQHAQARKATIAIHCVAGLGRAPVLVAIALIESGKYSVLEAIEYVRSKRKGALNRRQLQYLSEYRRRKDIRKKGFCCFLV